MLVSELDTPALLVDLDIMERNLRRVAAYASSHSLRLRPHTKTHKSPEIGRRQLAMGAAGLTVAKTSEAEVMLQADPGDLLIAFPVIGRAKLDRLVKLAAKTRITVAVDSEVAATALSEAARAAHVEIGLLLEIDVGLARVGVSPDDALPLARIFQRLPGLCFRGITFYPGHIKDPAGQDSGAIVVLGQTISRMKSDFRSAGIPVEIISGGSTPALFHSHRIEGLNEIRPGTYVYNDLNTIASGACALDDCAASILATVVSTARPGQFIIDGGSKTFSSDRSASSNPVTFGRVVEAPGCVFQRMNEEHGFVDSSKAERNFAVGDRVRVIPNHICVAVNLHEQVFGIRGNVVEGGWKVEGRGKLQ